MAYDTSLPVIGICVDCGRETSWKHHTPTGKIRRCPKCCKARNTAGLTKRLVFRLRDFFIPPKS